MKISKRQQRRVEYLEKNKERIEKLIEKYGKSEQIQEKIREIEKRGSSGGELSVNDVKELEVLNSQYRVLREHERNNKGGNNNNNNNISSSIVKNRFEDKEDKKDGGIRILSLKERSVFWDAELNPLGRQPIEECRLNYSFQGDYVIPFKSNIEEEEIGRIVYPVEDKPKFYRNYENRTVYEG